MATLTVLTPIWARELDPGEPVLLPSDDQTT
jgi:hypothetical protein